MSDEQYTFIDRTIQNINYNIITIQINSSELIVRITMQYNPSLFNAAIEVTIQLIPHQTRLQEITSSVRETGIFRHHGGTI